MTFPDRGWLRFVVAVLAAWRVTHLLANEDGPADMIARVRVLLGNGFLGELADCFQCLSLWVATPIAFLTTRDRAARPLVVLAISGAACLLERIGQAPVVVRPIPETIEGGISDEMLWRETSGVSESAQERAVSTGSTDDTHVTAAKSPTKVPWVPTAYERGGGPLP